MKNNIRSAQHQPQQPGFESEMSPRPQSIRDLISVDLSNKVALITGGDSGIGRAVAIAFARNGADITFTFLNEKKDAEETKRLIEEIGRRCLTFGLDLGVEENCNAVVCNTIDYFGHIDILVNNIAEQHEVKSLLDLDAAQLEKTFRTNVFSYFFMTKAALKHLKPGGSIINTTSVTAYRGSPHLIDYSSTKGAIVTFTRSLAKQLLEKGIRVNGVAPGPVWTPLIPASFSAEDTAKFGSNSPMHRAAEPDEIAPSYVFLASKAASFMSGQFLHPNGGEILNV